MARYLIASISLQKSGFDPREVYLRFSVNIEYLVRFLSSTSVFPCQYHSTNVPYIFIHLPPTPYNVSLPALQFPLSVPFHQRPIPIHSPTTHTIKCLPPSTSVSPVSNIPPMLHTHSFTYHPRYIIFLSQYFSFPLSVPFHQCSIPTLSPTTHAI